jgi:hypothetical protein
MICSFFALAPFLFGTGLFLFKGKFMPKQKQFPDRRLNKTMEANSSVDPLDVLEIKVYLQQKGLYEVPDYGLTPYPDAQLFSAIQKYQKQKGLKVDGVIKPNGETQKSMQIESEKLPPLSTPEAKIPGTNIPDRSVPEEGWNNAPYYSSEGPYYEQNKNADPRIVIKPPVSVDPNMPEYGQIPLPRMPYPKGGRY